MAPLEPQEKVLVAAEFFNSNHGKIACETCHDGCSAIAALKQMTAHLAVVLRDGQSLEIPASELVPGDVVLFEAGDAVPADLRVVKAVQLKIDEAALAGERLAGDAGTQ